MSKCKKCGSDVRFDPASQLLKCDACGEGTRIATQDSLMAERQEYDDIKEYICPQCGGSIFTTDSTAATFCSFCGTSVVLQCQDANYENPDAIIPFKVTEEEAKAAYLKKVKAAPFAPAYLKEDKKVEKTRGIYMPYKVADFAAAGPTALTSTHTYTSGNYDITETTRHTFQSDAFLSVSHDALREFSNVISEGIAPFEMDAKKEYSPAYLSGFYADKADTDSDKFASAVTPEAKALIKKAIIKKGIGRHTLKSVENMPEATCDNISTVLCPVWFISNRQSNGSVSYAAVNGQTGEVAAELPIDKKRFLIIAGLIAIVAYIALILTSSFTPHNALGIMGSLALVAAYVLREEAEELYVHNKEMEGIEIPVKQSISDKPVNWSMVFLACFFGFIPTIFIGSILHALFGPAGIVAGVLGLFLLLKKKFAQFSWFQKVFGRDYEIPKGCLTKYVIKPLLAAGFAMLMFLFDPVQDWIQYVSAAAVFAVTLWSFLDIISVHNQMTTRKPQQLNKRGGDEVE